MLDIQYSHLYSRISIIKLNWIEFEALHVFAIKHTEFEFWVEFEVRHWLFKRFKSWIELYIRYLRSLIFYIKNLKSIGYSVFTAFLKSDF